MALKLPKKISSNTIYLRPLTISDAKQYYINWLNDKEVNRFLESRFNDHSIEDLKKYISNFDQKSRFLFGIFDNTSDLHIGNLTLDISPHNVAYFGYLIGEKNYWGTPAATEAICLILDFAFNFMKVRKVWGGISKSNLPAIFNIHRLGFQREGTLRQQVTDKGKITDVLQYGLLRDEWAISKEKFKKIKRIIK